MPRTIHPLAALAGSALWLLAGSAAAHTGHGHDGLSVLQGLRHAVGEPDHLLMLAFGFGFTALAAPRVLRWVRQGVRLIRQRDRAARLPQRAPR